MERITIVGMGPIGASIGLGLLAANLSNTEVVGSSGNRRILSEVSEMGAVDKVIGRLSSAVDGAQLVVLDVPITKMKEVLEYLGPVLDDGCIVTDTATIKTSVIELADRHLPAGISFIGGHPLPKKQPKELNEADADLFHGTHYCVIPAKSADREAANTVVGMVEALGAHPLFLDPQEHDSYAAAMTYLPIVLSSAFVTATTGTIGWRDMHRLAASEFGKLSRLAADDPLENEAACLADTDSLTRWLDRMIAELYSYRNQINEQSSEFLDTLAKAKQARASWETDTVITDARPPMPNLGDTLATGLFGRRLVERYRQMTGHKKKGEPPTTRT